MERGNLAAAVGDMEGAVRLYSAVLEQQPDRPDAIYERGRAYESLGLLDKAISDYEDCMRVDPDYEGAINNKGVCLAKQQQHEAAIVEFTKLIDRNPQNVLALRNRGLCYHDTGQFQKAEADYELAIQVTADDAETWFQKGNLALDQGQTETALDDFSEAIRVAPEFAKAWMNRGVAKFSLGQPSEGMKDLVQAQQLDDRILIPDLDWVKLSQTKGLPLQTSEDIQPEWSTVVQAATSILEQQQYTEIRPLMANPVERCGTLAASKDGKTVIVYLAESSGASVRIPVPDEQHDGPKALLVLKPSTSGSKPEAHRFDQDWSLPKQVDSQPTIRIRMED